MLLISTFCKSGLSYIMDLLPFENESKERSFNKVIKVDPHCHEDSSSTSRSSSCIRSGFGSELPRSGAERKVIFSSLTTSGSESSKAVLTGSDRRLASW